jgi:hypothetical protein
VSVYRDMAHDGGYRGDEAEQVARMLEEQHREECERPDEWCDSCCGGGPVQYSPDHDAHFCEGCFERESDSAPLHRNEGPE